MMSANRIKNGIMSTAAMIRVTTRKRTGSRPIVVSAFSSSLTFIVPISAANAAPERPASSIAVISGPKLAQDRQADQIGNEDFGAELAHGHCRLKRENQPEQE